MRHCCIICLWKGKIVSLLYELSLERKKKVCFVGFVFEKKKHFHCYMIRLGKVKTFSLLYDLS